MKLADWMAEQEIDDAELGALVGVHRVTISRVRRGVQYPSWALARLIMIKTQGAVTADDFINPPVAAE